MRLELLCRKCCTVLHSMTVSTLETIELDFVSGDVDNVWVTGEMGEEKRMLLLIVYCSAWCGCLTFGGMVDYIT